jgi:hypothetical protein
MHSLNSASFQVMPEFLLASEIRRGAGLAAVKSVEFGADLGAFADRVAGQAFIERRLAGRDVLSLQAVKRAPVAPPPAWPGRLWRSTQSGSDVLDSLRLIGCRRIGMLHPRENDP